MTGKAGAQLITEASSTSCSNMRDVTWTVIGTVDTTDFSTNENLWTDGYKVSSTIKNAVSSGTNQMYGSCVVYMKSSTEEDSTNGAICQIIASDGTVASSTASNGRNLVLIPSSKWVANGGTMTISKAEWTSYTLTLDKYNLIFSPPRNVATAPLESTTTSTSAAFTYKTGDFCAGCLSAVTWYQPREASTYEGLRRYSKDDYIQGYGIYSS